MSFEIRRKKMFVFFSNFDFSQHNYLNSNFDFAAGASSQLQACILYKAASVFANMELDNILPTSMN